MASIEERLSQNGEKTYRVKVRLKGKPAETATFKRLTDAKKWAASIESAIREGRHFKSSEAKKNSFGDMIDRYIKSILPQKPKSLAKQKMQLEWWKSQLGAYTLADITPSNISSCKDKLLNEYIDKDKSRKRSPATVVRYLAALSHCYSIAVNEWGLVQDSPMKKVKKPKEPRGRVRFLDDKERERLLEECKKSKSKFLYPIVITAISTGMRYSEILNLTWDKVDLKRGIATIEETKNGERRAVPITGLCKEVLQGLFTQRRIDTNLLFPESGKQNPRPVVIRDSWESALEAAKISDFRFHDLRHCTASYLAMNGATLSEVAEVLGHKTLAMVKRYSHMTEAHTSAIVEKMNKKLFG